MRAGRKWALLTPRHIVQLSADVFLVVIAAIVKATGECLGNEHADGADARSVEDRIDMRPQGAMLDSQVSGSLTLFEAVREERDHLHLTQGELLF